MPDTDKPVHQITPEQLRGEAALLDAHTASWVCHLPPMLRSAADEIDRLRAERRLLRGALRALVEWGREVPAPRDTDHRERGYLAFDKAKRALRGKR